MFDSLLQEVAKKFGLGNKTSWILSTLLSYLFNRNTGGLSGFLDQLTHNGLGQVVNSWLGKGKPMAINAAQVDQAMGHGVIDNLASKLDLESSSVSKAVADMLPTVVSELTPNGVIPDAIPSNLAHYLKEDNPKAEIRASVLNHPQDSHLQHKDYNIVSERDREKTGFNWWWLLLLPLLLLLGWCGLKQKEQAPVSTLSPASISEPEVPAASIATIDSSLSIHHQADRFNISGTVADDATKESILAQLNSVMSSDKISGNIDVDPSTRSADWSTKLSGILPALKDAPGATLSLKGNDIVLDGNVEQGKINGLMEALKGGFGTGYNIRSQAVGLVVSPPVLEPIALEPAPNSIDIAPATLSETNEPAIRTIEDRVISSSGVAGESLVSALNIAEINFASGSYAITWESMAILRDAARAIKAAPADTRIQVGGHTDSTGSSHINMSLSGQRAQAVMDALVNLGVDAAILSAEGYGDLQPIADNSSPEGRSQNRRMEFTLQ